jgi:hypothetical protein
MRYDVKKMALAAPVAALLLATPTLAADAAAPPDPALAKFRSAYTSGSGLANVVIPATRESKCIATATPRAGPR